MMQFRGVFYFVFCFSIYSLSAQSDERTLMRIGAQEVTVSEFRYIYEKNNGKSADYSQQSLQEYADLYSRFKLKVARARQMQLDTISELKQELEGYRKQLASSYLIDKEVTEYLLRELYDRMKEDVEFSHIFIPVNESAAKTTKDEARNKITEVRTKVLNGLSFEEAAKTYSEDKVTAGKGGYMGFFTAKLPSGFYQLETALYQTKVGEVSDVIETRIGYHLIKVAQRRPARGTVEVAHILVKEDRKSLIDSLYSLLKSGADFDMLALQYSQDKTTSRNGGKLPPFGINVYDKAFEDAAFRLSENGGISAPLQTKSGWHVLKRLNKPQSDSYEVFVRKMKSQISKDSRFEAGRMQLIDDIKKAAGFKEDKSSIQKLVSSLNEEFYSYKWVPDPSLPAVFLFSLGGDEIHTLSDFAAYCRKNTKTRLKYDKTKPYTETIEELYQEFVNETALSFEEKLLPVKYPDFKSLMREYEEGILLFEATRIHVWDKANQDTIGLEAFYSREKSRYMWPEKAAIAQCTLKVSKLKDAEKIANYMRSHSIDETVKKFQKIGTELLVSRTESEKGGKEMEGLEWSTDYTSAIKLGNDTTYMLKKVEKILPPRNKTLSESRGYVVADYQDLLEKEWVSSLGMEFQVTIYHDVLTGLQKK